VAVIGCDCGTSRVRAASGAGEVCTSRTVLGGTSGGEERACEGSRDGGFEVTGVADATNSSADMAVL
jgi:hypothetical protein